MKIVCFHLFNDYSGSPKVLHNVLSGLLNRSCEVDLITSRGGVLDTISSPNLVRRSYRYSFSAKPVATMIRYASVQLLTFFMALRYAFDKDSIFYINTILPIGPALAGKLTGKKVIYHYHENASVKSGFYRMLAKGMQKLADKIICVSAYQASYLNRKQDVAVIPNVLDDSFLLQLTPDIEAAFDRKNILMLSSLKEYKGTKEFIDLASALPDYRFTLVINDTQTAIDNWLVANSISVPQNISIHPRTNDVASFYNNATLVLNLSNPDLFVETFGLTALEAMSCALPVIVPPVGGIAEMVADGENGYKIDCRDTDRLIKTICNILSDRLFYNNLAQNAWSYSKKNNHENMIDSLISFINK